MAKSLCGTPGESEYFGDFYKLHATIPAAEAFRPLKDVNRRKEGAASTQIAGTAIL
jgi:hypothetical protein